MYLLLPPSETKEPGGDGPPLNLQALPFTGLNRVRAVLISAAVRLSKDPEAARTALHLGTSAAADEAISANTQLETAATRPALARYTGVLYAGLAAPSWTPIQSARASGRILISSAMFGLLTAESQIPTYRLSSSSTLPGLPTIAALWRAELATAFAQLEQPVLDLRSGSYAAFASVPGAIDLRVVTHRQGGVVRAVSHENKAIKGRLARLLATSRADIGDIGDLLRVARRAGFTVRRNGSGSIDLDS